MERIPAASSRAGRLRASHETDDECVTRARASPHPPPRARRFRGHRLGRRHRARCGPWSYPVRGDRERGRADLVDQIERATLRAFQVPSEAGAYGHYLLGQQALQVLDLPSTRRARASFKAAMSLSPDFAPAYTGFAQTMIYEWVIRGRGDTELLLRARHAAERAREIDPLFGSAHQMLGRASLFRAISPGSSRISSRPRRSTPSCRSALRLRGHADAQLPGSAGE